MQRGHRQVVQRKKSREAFRNPSESDLDAWAWDTQTITLS